MFSHFGASLLILAALFHSAPAKGNEETKEYFGVAYDRMGLFIRETLVEHRLTLTESEMKTLIQVLGGLATESPAKETLNYDADPASFDFTENRCLETKLAYTNAKPKPEVIYLNWPLFADKGLSFTTVVQILFHELGHHHTDADHKWLDGIGAKVGRVAQALLEKEKRQGSEEPEIPLKPLFAPGGKRYDRRETSGVFFPHRIEAPGDTSKADIFFMENGSSKVYRLNFIVDTAQKVFERVVINGDVQFPFRGSIENLGKGTVIIVNGRQYLDDQTPGRKVDTIGVSSVWPAKNPNSFVVRPLVGDLLLSRDGKPILSITSLERRQTLGIQYVSLTFSDPEIEKQVMTYLRRYGPPKERILAFPTEKMEIHKGWGFSKIATVVFF